MKDFTVNEIENLTYDEVVSMAEEKVIIKDHECFFINFKSRVGYSVLVFKNKKHVYYANIYDTRFVKSTKELRDMYISRLNNKLFTDEELKDEINSYDEYKSKLHFLQNYWIMRYDYVSVCAISAEDIKAVNECEKTHPYYNPVCFCYVADSSIVDEAISYFKHINMEFEKLKMDDKAFKEMVSVELQNYEACITGRYEEDLNALEISFDELSKDRQEFVISELNRQIKEYC